MIDVGSVIKACAGSFDSELPSRPPPANFTQPPVGAGGTWTVPRYQPGDGATFCILSTNPKRAPYATKQWFVRNAQLPLVGQSQPDVDGVVGVTFPSPKGWAVANRILRVPKSLVLMGGEDLTPDSTDWAAAVEDAIGPLSAIGVDVYLINTVIGSSRFLTAVPVSAATFPVAAVDPFTPTLTLFYTSATVPNPTDMTGGDVMYATIGFYSTGYSVGSLNSSTGATPTDACYVSIVPDNDLSWSRASTLFATSGGFRTYLQIGTAAYEAALLNAIVPRTRSFRFDVYGRDDNEPTSEVPTLEECDTLFRNGVPGSAYHYSLDPRTPATLAVLAQQVVANALAFFS